MTKLHTLGILGTGKAGSHHAKAALTLGCSIYAGSARSAHSQSWGTFKKIAPDARFLEPKTLLDDPNIDAVIVSLPWNVTPEWIPALLRSPKPMLIEKPLALEAATLIRVASQADAKLENKLVGFNRRHYATVCRVAERIKQGGLRAASVTISEDMGHHVQNHGTAIIPHVLAFSSAHTLDLLLHLFGPLKIVGLSARNEKRFPGTKAYNGLLENAGGVPILLALNMSDPSPAGIRLLFEDGTTWVLSPLERLSIYDKYEIIEPVDKTQVRQYRPHLREEIQEPTDGYKPGFLQQMRAFIENDFGPGATVRDSVALLEFIDALKGRP